MDSRLLPTASHTSEHHGDGREDRSLPYYMLGLPGFASSLGIPMVFNNVVGPPGFSSSVPIPNNMKRSLTSRLSHGMEAPFNLTHVETDSISTVSQTQWESRKEVIRALYLTQKLPLKQIKVIMARTYSFCATERMYQRQFVKWRWKKYNTKISQDQQAVERPPGFQTCRRPPRRDVKLCPTTECLCSQCLERRSCLSFLSLNHASTENQVQYDLFVSLRDLILGTASRDPSWSERRKLSSHETAGDRLFNLFRMADSLYMSGDSARAGATFRQCFRMLEEVIRDEPINFYQALFFNIPFRLPTEELLKVYLYHLHQLFNLKRYGEPIARMAAATHLLATEAACHLLPSIYRMHDITADYYRKIRGETGMESLEARMDALILSEGEDKSQECNHIIECFRELLNDTISQFGTCSVEAIFVEHWQIDAATSLGAPSDDIVRLCEDHISRLIASNDDRRLCDWSLLSLDRYESVQYNLYKVFVESGDMQRGILHLKDSILAAEYAVSRAVDHDWKTSTACQLLQNQLELVDCLSVMGQVDEADGIKAMIAASEYLEEVVQNDLGENFAELLAC